MLVWLELRRPIFGELSLNNLRATFNSWVAKSTAVAPEDSFDADDDRPPGTCGEGNGVSSLSRVSPVLRLMRFGFRLIRSGGRFPSPHQHGKGEDVNFALHILLRERQVLAGDLSLCSAPGLVALLPEAEELSNTSA